MGNLLTSYKTTVCGTILLLCGIGFYLHKGDPTVAVAIITAGVGLLAAKDYNVTGGTKQQ